MLASRFVECLESYVGIKETPMGSNNTVIGVEFGWTGVSWCNMTQSLALCGAKWNGHSFDYADGFWNGSSITLPNPDYRKGWANVQSCVAAFSKAGRAGSVPKYPCLVAWQWSSNPMDSHIGAAIRAGSIITIEGNHNDQCQWYQRDDHANVLAYLYPPWDDAPIKPKEDDDMIRLFVHKTDGVFVGVFGAWKKHISTPGILAMMERSGFQWNNTDGSREVQDDVFQSMVDLATLATK